MPRLLATELTDAIIDHLWSDRRTLLACALVSHAWLPTSRMHLFASVSLTGPKTERGADAFVAWIVKRPDLSAYVRTVRVREAPRMNNSMKAIKKGRFGSRELLALLDALPSLRDVTLCNVTWDRSRVPEWAKSRKGRARLTARTIDRLSLESVYSTFHLGGSTTRQDLLDILSYFGKIRTLHLDGSFVYDATVTGASRGPASSLEVHDLTVVSGVLSGLPYRALGEIAGFFDSLRTLSIVAQDWTAVNTLNAYLRDVAPNIEDLRIDAHQCEALDGHSDMFPISTSARTPGELYMSQLPVSNKHSLSSFRLCLPSSDITSFWRLMYASTSRLPPSTQFIGAVAEYLTVAMMDPSIPIVLAQWEYFATTISRFPNLKIVDLTFWLPVTTAPGCVFNSDSKVGAMVC